MAYYGEHTESSTERAAWFRSATPELSGAYLLYNQTLNNDGTLNYEGAIAAKCGSEYNQIDTILVNLPNSTILNTEIFTIKFYNRPTSSSIYLDLSYRFGRKISGLGTSQDNPNHKNLGARIKCGNMYYHGSGVWNTTPSNYVVVTDGSDGYSYPISNTPNGGPIEVSFAQVASTGNNPVQLIALDTVQLKEYPCSYDDLNTRQGKTNIYKNNNGDGNGDESITQLFTYLRKNSNTVGTTLLTSHFTTFQYMLKAQNRLQLQFEQSTPFQQYYYMIKWKFMESIYNGWRFRLIASAFYPWDDEWKLTIHRSETIE